MDEKWGDIDQLPKDNTQDSYTDAWDSLQTNIPDLQPLTNQAIDNFLYLIPLVQEEDFRFFNLMFDSKA